MAEDKLLLVQARFVLRNLHVERPNCGYNKLADACERAAEELGRLRAVVRVNSLRAGHTDAEIDRVLED